VDRESGTDLYDLGERERVPSFCELRRLMVEPEKIDGCGKEPWVETYASFMPRYCFVNLHVNSIRIR
jgi:hypothetical protein